MSDKHEFAEFDIILFDKSVYGIERLWFGYITDAVGRADGTVRVRWWDDELFTWTGEQNVPRGTLIFIGRADG